jgi:tetratricopeptide (TPR) repeat protein
LGYVAGAASVQSNIAVFELYVGNVHKALAIYDRILPILEEVNAELPLCVAHFTRSEAYLLDGDRRRSLESAAKAHELARKMSARGLIAAARLSLGTATCENGDVDAGIALLIEAVEMRRRGGPVIRLIEALCAYLQALLDARRDDAARPIAEELRELYESNAEKAWRPTCVLSLLGQAARATGDESAAVGYFQRGRAMLQRETERFDDDESAAAFRDLPFNRALSDSRAG